MCWCVCGPGMGTLAALCGDAVSAPAARFSVSVLSWHFASSERGCATAHFDMYLCGGALVRDCLMSGVLCTIGLCAEHC